MILRTLKLTTRDPARAWLLTRMAWWVVTVSVLARTLSLPRALRIVATGVRPNTNMAEMNPARYATAVDAVLGADFLFFKPSCWKRAAVLHRYLALAGVATTIQFGVARESEGELKGHAWLELNGEPILETSPPVYTVTYSFPSNQPFTADLALLADLRPR